tara:strand:+ start:10632 stop:10988 length:357 start_codon:yes stop_codon:yes gene_type:complete
MARRLLDYDAEFGTKTFHDYDHQTKVTTIETVQDVAPFLEWNKTRQNFDGGGGGGLNERSKKQIRSGRGWHVASIPIGVQYEWLKEGVDLHNPDHWDRVKRKLNSREYQYLRVNPGVI